MLPALQGQHEWMWDDKLYFDAKIHYSTVVLQSLCPANGRINQTLPVLLKARCEVSVMQNMGGSLAREKDLGGDEVRTVEGGLFYIGRPGGQRLQYGVSGGYSRNGKTNRNREFTGPRFTRTIANLRPTR